MASTSTRAPTVSRLGPTTSGTSNSILSGNSGASALPTFDTRQWEDELSKVDISKHDLNSLIFDYLLIEGYPDAAVEFARETGLPADVDHEKVQERMEIRQAVEDGRVEEAVRRVNELDPEILDTNPPLLFHLHLLRMIELIRSEEIDKALAFATEELAPRGAENPEFRLELERTMGLLAFPDLVKFADDTGTSINVDDSEDIKPIPLETLQLFSDPSFTPLISLMKKSYRVEISKELNSAILENQGHGRETKLNGLIRLMAFGENKLVDAGLGLPVQEKEKGRNWAKKILNLNDVDS
ncbi:hypothetical protein V865_003454 [Kwoniella europaea PYCC6329]|uniref:CTLH domain-containing protein n=1 Tax=Kwoniella europaea PYCC6329 TaxID=1423913 RepID=A0AAX4KH48_9TREE